MKINGLLIIGMARSGIAAALAARRAFPGARVVLADSKAEPEAAGEAGALEKAGVRVELGRDDTELLSGCELVIKSPGVPGEIDLLKEAGRRGIPVWGEIEFARRFLDNLLVGVTGTNGKTTTTELIGHILREAGRPCRVAGNVGTALSSLIGQAGGDEILIVELSSFQLEDTAAFRPDIAVLLNMAEDHLDRHFDSESYFSAKMMIFANQQGGDLAILNFDDREIRAREIPGGATRLWFSRREAAGVSGKEAPSVYARQGKIFAGLEAVGRARGTLSGRMKMAAETGLPGRKATADGENSEYIIDWSEAGLKGEHNLENSLAATAVCLSLGLSGREVAGGLRSFKGVEHRLQPVREVDGVIYVNDSKATNVDAALKALTAYKSGIHLILGGESKGCSFDPLAEAAGGKVKEVILIGEAAPEIAASFKKAGREAAVVEFLEQAVAIAWQNAVPGDVVLFSPACASFDQFKNFEERGERFIALVNQMKARGT